MQKLTTAGSKAHQFRMLKVRVAPVIEPDGENGWTIVLLFGAGFNEDIPFRKILAEIVEILRVSRDSSLELPPYVDGEDGVEGTMTFGTERLTVYYEQILAYLSLSSSVRATLEDVAARILPAIRVEDT